MKPKSFNQEPQNIIQSDSRNIYCFPTDVEDQNIEDVIVDSFGEEWEKFNQFSDHEINKIGNMYFDIIDDKIINSNTYGIDIGCGTGRWTKFLLDRIGFMEVVDPSKAIMAADKLLENKKNVRLSMASTDNLPFNDETFDFGMSIGVLHHIPNTEKALKHCVNKIKKGGYFYVYLYYNFESRGIVFKTLFYVVNTMRRMISRLPSRFKKWVCDAIALCVYMPIVLIGRFISFIGFKKIAKVLPLSMYQHCSFYIIRNDALDRFGTSLEQRFSKEEIRDMMIKAGLEQIVISESTPYWHAVGRKL
ncbi:MAG: class I SAM-dependent methyltransferase [Crocinitomicaceae bacterium]|jgi:ubiquinone/menaquinone biosynthesis C-methylase UbiE|nr:class I SAM-dependent methyltransferase [Crocinitomicaceae bacterium]MBT6515646.1 class I SAM-dependent methyltransferase [Crocinitomicaceae bacterium]